MNLEALDHVGLAVSDVDTARSSGIRASCGWGVASRRLGALTPPCSLRQVPTDYQAPVSRCFQQAASTCSRLPSALWPTSVSVQPGSSTSKRRLNWKPRASSSASPTTRRRCRSTCSIPTRTSSRSRPTRCERSQRRQVPPTPAAAALPPASELRRSGDLLTPYWGNLRPARLKSRAENQSEIIGVRRGQSHRPRARSAARADMPCGPPWIVMQCGPQMRHGARTGSGSQVDKIFQPC
jgi:hypothetical protein